MGQIDSRRTTPPPRICKILQMYVGNEGMNATALSREIGISRDALMSILSNKTSNVSFETSGKIISWVFSADPGLPELPPPLIQTVPKKVVVDEKTIQNDKLITSEKSAASAPDHAPGHRGPRKRRKPRPDKLSSRLVGTVNGTKV